MSKSAASNDNSQSRDGLAGPSSRAAAKAAQRAKITELREALVVAGFHGLDDQAAALGLSRSTAWTVLGGRHKASGLSAFIVKRMLSSPLLPHTARRTLHEYIEQKLAGAYGHGPFSRRMFQVRVGRVAPASPCDAKNIDDAQPLGFRRRHKR